MCNDPRDIDGQFLQPSHSFGHDAAFGGGGFDGRPIVDMRWEDVLAVVAAKDTTPFSDKADKTFLLADINSGPKGAYFAYMADNMDVSDGYFPTNDHSVDNLRRSCGDSTRCYDALSKAKKTGDAAASPDVSFRYKYVAYADGTTLSGRTKLLLAINAVMIRQAGSVWEEFFVPGFLRSGVDFLEYGTPDEIRGIVERGLNGDDAYGAMRERNRRFVREVLTYDNLLA